MENELKELKTNEAVAIEEPYFDERGVEILAIAHNVGGLGVSFGY